jgi:SSS family solute:Na+ symporter
VVREHFGGSSFALAKLGLDVESSVYAGFLALLANLIVAVLVTFALRAMKVDEGVDGTAESDYTAEREDPTFRDLPDPLESAPPGAAGQAAPRR